MTDNGGVAAFQRGLRVESMGADTRRLGSELSLEIWIRFFNATGEKVRVTGVDGSLTFGEGKEEFELRPAAMDRRFKAEVDHLSGTIIVVEQPVPREIAEKILAISTTHKVVFNSQSLDIVVASIENRSKEIRLPLWNLWEIHGEPAAPSASQIITGNLNIQLKPAVAGDPPSNLPISEPKAPEKPLRQKLTEEEFSGWVRATSVIEQLNKKLTIPGEGIQALMPYLRRGLIRAGAFHHAVDSKPTAGVIEIEPERWPEEMTRSRLWRTGTLQIAYPHGQHPYTNLIYFDVRFNNHDLGQLIGAVIPPPLEITHAAAAPSPALDPPPPLAHPRHAGGRPRYGWWDEVWVHIGAKLAIGWKPVKQVEIEAEMKSIAENYEPNIADSTIRLRASKLATALKLKAEN